jgi:hypothetical protein
MKLDEVPTAAFTIDRILYDRPVSFKRHSYGITAVAAFSNEEQDFLNYRLGSITALKRTEYRATPLSPQHKANTAVRKIIATVCRSDPLKIRDFVTANTGVLSSAI